MRALIIDDDVKTSIQSCIKYAEENVFTSQDIIDMINEKKAPAGDDENRIVLIPVGYRVAFSLEDQPSGRYKRISISVPTTGKMPSIPAAQEIIKEFGYISDIRKDGGDNLMVSMEEIGDDHHAIQFVEKVK